MDPIMETGNDIRIFLSAAVSMLSICHILSLRFGFHDKHKHTFRAQESHYRTGHKIPGSIPVIMGIIRDIEVRNIRAVIIATNISFVIWICPSDFLYMVSNSFMTTFCSVQTNWSKGSPASEECASLSRKSEKIGTVSSLI